MKLIDASELWSDIMMIPHNGDIISSEEVEQAIKDAPAVDAVPVVKCENCKHYVWDEFDGCHCCISLGKFVKPDFWCANGKKKKEGA